MRKNEKGFTLIEVLTVIMIIAILASVILVSLDVARERTKDTVIMNQVGQFRALAEATYTFSDGYKEIAEDTSLYSKVSEKITEMGGTLEVVFSDNNKSYCAYSPLVRGDDRVFCVDSTGNAVEGDSTNNVATSCSDNGVCESGSTGGAALGADCTKDSDCASGNCDEGFGICVSN